MPRVLTSTCQMNFNLIHHCAADVQVDQLSARSSSLTVAPVEVAQLPEHSIHNHAGPIIYTNPCTACDKGHSTSSQGPSVSMASQRAVKKG